MSVPLALLKRDLRFGPSLPLIATACLVIDKRYLHSMTLHTPDQVASPSIARSTRSCPSDCHDTHTKKRMLCKTPDETARHQARSVRLPNDLRSQLEICRNRGTLRQLPCAKESDLENPRRPGSSNKHREKPWNDSTFPCRQPEQQ